MSGGFVVEHEQVTHIKERRGNNVVVICPYCGQEHEHFNTGLNVAICLAGTYTIIEKP